MNNLYIYLWNNSIFFLLCNDLRIRWMDKNTQPVWTIFLFKSIWARSQGSQGCQKIRFYFSKMKVLRFCAKIAPERHKLQKPIKIGKKCQKIPVSLDFFEYSSIWGQYQRIKPQMACLVDPGPSFDPPGTPEF